MPTRFLIHADKSITEFIYRIQRTQIARTTLKRHHNWRTALPDLTPQWPRQRGAGDGAQSGLQKETQTSPATEPHTALRGSTGKESL